MTATFGLDGDEVMALSLYFSRFFFHYYAIRGCETTNERYQGDHKGRPYNTRLLLPICKGWETANERITTCLQCTYRRFRMFYRHNGVSGLIWRARRFIVTRRWMRCWVRKCI